MYLMSRGEDLWRVRRSSIFNWVSQVEPLHESGETAGEKTNGTGTETNNNTWYRIKREERV